MFFFFFNDTATTEIYTLSLHDALPILTNLLSPIHPHETPERHRTRKVDRKSTRLNSSHANISYAVFCLKKKMQFLTNYPASIPARDACLCPTSCKYSLRFLALDSNCLS